MASADEFGTGPAGCSGCSVNVVRTQSPVIVNQSGSFWILVIFNPGLIASFSLSLSSLYAGFWQCLYCSFTVSGMSQSSPSYNYSVKIMNPKKKSEFEIVQMKRLHVWMT